MKIAVLSGKGGAGKTFVSVNLAVAAGNYLSSCRGDAYRKEKDLSVEEKEISITYIDCDVEEPNGRLFLKPEDITEITVGKLLPEFDAGKCNGCKECVQFCRFHALMYIKEKPMVFSEVCHSCGGCMMVCPENAVSEISKPIGKLEIGNQGDIRVVTGILNPGEASGIPIIKEALKQASDVTIIDCPPGSACSVMESVMDADYCVLVVEPTTFGFHNFKMVHELTALLHRKCGVVVNKETAPYEPLEVYCKEQGIAILARIPYDPQIASMTAEGQVIFESAGRTRELFHQLYNSILMETAADEGETGKKQLSKADYKHLTKVLDETGGAR